MAGTTISSQNLLVGQKGKTNTVEVVLGATLFSHKKWVRISNNKEKMGGCNTHSSPSTAYQGKSPPWITN